MPKITKTYTFSDAEALDLAMGHGYTEKVVDESLLNEDGTVPLVQGKNEDGSLRFQVTQDVEEETLKILSEEILIVDGKPVPYMEALNVYIKNPVSPDEFMSVIVDAAIMEVLIMPIKAKAKRDQNQAQREAADLSNATVRAVEKAVAQKIETVIN